ncbi:hypothetical protein QR680_015470 [Steinernema hermaphroditum]|uniref:Uncharacterized protein n=1 Tax=Steinernema hermaphroditum TaxID=289476 RepID=A0AA39H7S4_9BILA|nr:hypothetical protein QR680_015470 [Steinernema hermaphroditum]
MWKPGTVVRVIPAEERLIDRNQLTGLNFAIDTTWDGKPVDHDPTKIRMAWNVENRQSCTIKISIEAPLFDECEEPDDYLGILTELPNADKNYQVVQFFFANSKNQRLVVTLGPHGHWLVTLHDGDTVLNNGEEMELSIQNEFMMDMWHCTFELPVAYLPPKAHKFNACAVHGTAPNRIYESLCVLTEGCEEKPDFHKLEDYRHIDMRRVVPDAFREEAYIAPTYGDVWGVKGSYVVPDIM